MDFAQAEARFNHLRDQLRDGTISRAEFVQAVGQIMVYDAQGRYWTLDPRTGHWLYFDGQTWVEALGQSQLPTVQAMAPVGTPPPYPYTQDKDSPNWLLLGIAGLAALALCLLGIIAAAIVIGVGAAGGSQTNGQGPTVQIQSPMDDAQVQVNQEIVVQSTSADAQGVTRVELWVDGNLGPVTFSSSEGGQPTLVAAQQWTFLQPGAHTIQVRARNRANAEGTSPLITVNVLGTSGVTPSASPSQAAPTATTSTTCTDAGDFVADVTIPDGTQVQPGTQVDKVWRFRNTGTCSWGAGYRWVYVSGEKMGAPESVAVPATAPGQEADLRVVFTAPQAPGTYVSRWQMQAPDDTPFGTVAILSIVVRPVVPTKTPRPTATRTPMVSPTPGPIISFTVDKKKIALGQCTNLRWDVEYVREVWLKEGGDPEYPEVGHKVKEICPTVNTTYVLRIVKYDGSSESHSITVKVTP